MTDLLTGDIKDHQKQLYNEIYNMKRFNFLHNYLSDYCDVNFGFDNVAELFVDHCIDETGCPEYNSLEDIEDIMEWLNEQR